MRSSSGVSRPALVVAILAVASSATGVAFADSGTTASALTKSKVKKIANKQINQLAPGLSVAHADTATNAANATHADNATHAATATRADTATNADTVGGRNAAELESRVFDAQPSQSNPFVPVPAGGPTIVQTLNLPAGTYLIIARGEIENTGGDESLEEIECTLETDQTFGWLLRKVFLAPNGDPGESAVGASQIVDTFDAPGQARIRCTPNSAWGGGNMIAPTISAVSLQP